MFSKNNASKTSSSTPSAPMEVPTMKKPSSTSTRPAGNSVPSILGRDIIITGDIKTEGEVQVDGRLDGNIIASVLTVGESGSVNGTIKADRVLIRGKVQGKVTAIAVELAETANVAADLTQDELSIANGAFFDGKCARKTKAPTPLKPNASKQTA